MASLYFIAQSQGNTPTYQLLLERLSRLASSANGTSLPPWQLIHHLCVDTSSLLPSNPSGPSPIHPRRYLQFLALPHHRQGSMYIGASSREEPKQVSNTKPSESRGNGMTIISVPRTQVEDFFQTVQKKMEPLWSYRMAIRVDNGLGYEIGDWKIRIGEVRQMSAGQPRPRGVVVEVALGSDTEEDENSKDEMFKGVWEQLGLQGGKVFIDVPGTESTPGDLDLVKQYMELLKFARTDVPVKV